jgi:hypothetical protein
LKYSGGGYIPINRNVRRDGTRDRELVNDDNTKQQVVFLPSDCKQAARQPDRQAGRTINHL